MQDSLKRYNAKRNRARTPEPFDIDTDNSHAKTFESNDKLRFVVQLHDASRLHFDFRLEWNGILLSWAIPKGPSYNPRDKRLAVKVEDHPLGYADFEGTIPKGEYGGGTVMLWDEGIWVPHENPTEGLEKGDLKFALDGKRLKGNWALVRMNKKNEKEDNWLLIKEKDDFVKETDSISNFKKSVRSGKTMKQIAEYSNAKSVKNPFDALTVELAKLTDKVPKDDNILYEIKYDGFRIVAFCQDGKVRLITRNGLDYSDKYPPVKDALVALSRGRSMILDGELIVADENGKSDFHALQQYSKNPLGKNLNYIVFDLLALDGNDMREQPLISRKEKLENLLDGVSPTLEYSQHIKGQGEQFFTLAAAANLEGIVGKRADSPYRSGRNGDWIKLKCRPRQEFFIGGYTRSAKKTTGISSLIVGFFDNKQPVCVGRVGTGFSEKEGQELEKTLAKYKTDKNPFSNTVKISKFESVFWLVPHAVAEVEYAELIEGKVLRQASYKGLREDKSATNITLELPNSPISKQMPKSVQTKNTKHTSFAPQQSEHSMTAVTTTIEKSAKQNSIKKKLNHNSTQRNSAERNSAERNSTQRNSAERNSAERNSAERNSAERNSAKRKNDLKTEKTLKRTTKSDNSEPCVQGITVSNPNKTVFKSPKTITKLEVAEYYDKVATRMFPHVGNRILSVVRCHKGISGDCFFKKHPASEGEGVEVVQVENSEADNNNYFCLRHEVGLVAQAQLGTLEFHIWGSSADCPEKPNMMVFDLDPDEGMDISKIREGVRDLKGVLDKLGIKSFLKTSGGKGYHIVVPFEPCDNWDIFHNFARSIAEYMQEKWPDKYTANIRKNKRDGKIFIDWLRNGRGATSVAPYSLRARIGAKVSMPISFSELDRIAPDDIDMFVALKRLKRADPWKDFFTVKQKLKSPICD